MPQTQASSNIETQASASNAAAAPRAAISPNDLAALCEQQIGRRGQRVALERPAELFAVSLDGMLDGVQPVSGRTREISARGLLVEVPDGHFHNAQPLLLGIHLPESGLQYAGLLVRRSQPTADQLVQLGMEFGGPAADVLAAVPLLPEFDSSLQAFVTPHATQVYDNWVEAGVMEKTLLDRVLVCHVCGALPTVRNACRHCNSGRLTTDRLIHHFACAFVGFDSDFEQSPGELACPKCRMTKLVVGSDFEYLTGQYRCRSCGWRDSEAELCGHCLRCGNRFELSQAREQELYRYDVRRLDPLAVADDLA